MGRLLLLASCTASLALVAAQSTFTPFPAGQKCPLARVDHYQLNCDVDGWVLDPATLKHIHDIPNATTCATKCFAEAKCKSFRYDRDKHSRPCTLFSKPLEDMYVDVDNPQPGSLFDRECYTDDCNNIAVCQTRTPCTVVKSHVLFSDIYWVRYACSYGFVSRSYHENSTVKLLDGKTSSCAAARQCAQQMRADDQYGSLDLHYHIPSSQWVCITYEEFGDNPFYGYLEEIQHVGPRRFTIRNDSVGASYGYYVRDTQYNPEGRFR